jgi:hypothetical protein
MPWMKKSGVQTQLYQIIHIDGGRLRYETRTAIGDVYDAFELRKRANEPNELIELDAAKLSKRAGSSPQARPNK